MTLLKLFYRRGASAALLLGVIAGAPDIAQAVQLRGGSTPPSGPAPPPTSRHVFKARRTTPRRRAR
jgi:hypothetical protein